MVDVLLMHSLLLALPQNAKLILVGDPDQLPSVGAGRLFSDLITSEAVRTICLTEIFRQAQQSLIVMNAHAVNRGELPDLSRKDKDFFFMRRTNYRTAADTVLELCKTRLPETYHLTCLDGLQVLCPGRRGELGTIRINEQLRELLNPPADDKAEVKSMGCVLRVGDKVMHNHNNYDITWVKDNGEVGTGVFNGDIGILEKVNRAEGTVAVRYDNRVATYTREDLQDLELAYAITVHKSQGSEFDAVVLTVFGQQRQLCYRNLLYTAITRAKKLLILVGDEQTLWDMIENNRKTLRYSALTAFLTGEASGHADA